MAWLEKLDARSRTWALPNRVVYFGVKWYLAGLGGFCLIRLLLDRSGIWPLY